MPKLPDFLFSSNETALPGVRLIFYTRPPYYIGKVLSFKSEIEYNSFVNKWVNTTDFGVFTKIDGYRIVILYFGTLMPTNRNIKQQEIEAIFNNMANLFYKEKILTNLSGNKRYKENV